MRLIKDNDIILDGTLTRYEKEKQAFIKLGEIEEIMDQNQIADVKELKEFVDNYHKALLGWASRLSEVFWLKDFIKIKGLTKEWQKFIKEGKRKLEREQPK